MAEKDARWFKHDNNAFDDPKILDLRMEHGLEGYGIFWALIEFLRNDAEYKAEKNYKRLAFKIGCNPDSVQSIVEDFDLFEISEDGTYFYSKRLREDMGAKDDKKTKLSIQGIKGNLIKKKVITKTESEKLSDEEILNLNEQMKNGELTPPYRQANATLSPSERKAKRPLDVGVTQEENREEKRREEKKRKKERRITPPDREAIEECEKFYSVFFETHGLDVLDPKIITDAVKNMTEGADEQDVGVAMKSVSTALAVAKSMRDKGKHPPKYKSEELGEMAATCHVLIKNYSVKPIDIEKGIEYAYNHQPYWVNQIQKSYKNLIEKEVDPETGKIEHLPAFFNLKNQGEGNKIALKTSSIQSYS